MNTKSLFKFQSLVVMAVFSLIAVAGFEAKADPAPKTEMEIYVENCGKEKPTKPGFCLDSYNKIMGGSAGGCSQYASELKESLKSVSGLGQSRLTRYSKCFGEDADAGEEENSDDSDSSELANPRTCSSYLKSATCNEMNGGLSHDFEDALKDAKSTAKEAKQSVIDATKALSDAQKNGKRAADQAQTDQRKAGQQYQLKIQDLTNKMNDGLKNADQQAKQAAAQIRQQLLDLKKQLQSQNDKIREVESALTNAVISVEAQCRTEAKGARDKKEDELNRKEDEEKKAGVKYNYAGSSLAGSANRRKAKKTAQIQAVYLNTYKDCLAGTTAAGASAIAAIKSMQDKLQQTKASVAEQNQIIADQIQEQMKAMADLTASTEQAKQSLKQQIDLQMSAATIAYNEAMTAAQKAYDYAQQDMQSEVQAAQQSLQIATSSQKDADNAVTTGQYRLDCANSNGGHLAEGAADRLENMSEKVTALQSIQSTCPLALQQCSDDQTVQSVCGTKSAPSSYMKLKTSSVR